MRKIFVLVVLTLLAGCESGELSVDFSICNMDMNSYDFSYGIDYSEPDKYLVSGDQSVLNDIFFKEIRSSIGRVPHSVSGVLKICSWINRNFDRVSGNDIGNKTLNQLYAIRTIYDSHSAALIISGTLRKFGFPAVMIETASIQWAYDYRNGDKRNFKVHVMSEVYVNGEWILLNNNGTYVSDMNLKIRSSDAMNDNLYPQGLFVYAKGKDSWGYGVRRETDTRNKII